MFLSRVKGKYNLVEIQGIKCKHTTIEPLAITLLGTDKTPIISSKDPMSRLITSRTHVRDIHVSTHPIHSTASTTLSKMMTGCYGVLMTNGEDMVQEFMGKCVTCKKTCLLHYISLIGMSDTRMLPTVHPFAMLSVDPISSWPVLTPDQNIKKFRF